MRLHSLTLVLAIVVPAALLNPAAGFAQSAMARCLLDGLQDADDATSVGELRAACSELTADPLGEEFIRDEVTVYEENSIRERFEFDNAAESSGFAITPHLPNFFVHSLMAEPNQTPFTAFVPVDNPVRDQESMFQVSFKAPIWRDILGSGLDAYFAYSAKSWWQTGNDRFSNPFRETNYHPEIMLRGTSQHAFGDVSLEGWSLGFVHESNGREQFFSRSWNRIMANFAFQFGSDLSLLARTWYRLPEDDLTDNNPLEYHYYGYGDARLIWAPDKNTFTAMIRPGTETTSFEATWSYPLNRVFRFYASYYDGYGESMLDFDYRNRRFSLGIALNDFITRDY